MNTSEDAGGSGGDDGTQGKNPDERKPTARLKNIVKLKDKGIKLSKENKLRVIKDVEYTCDCILRDKVEGEDRERAIQYRVDQILAWTMSSYPSHREALREELTNYVKEKLRRMEKLKEDRDRLIRENKFPQGGPGRGWESRDKTNKEMIEQAKIRYLNSQFTRAIDILKRAGLNRHQINQLVGEWNEERNRGPGPPMPGRGEGGEMPASGGGRPPPEPPAAGPRGGSYYEDNIKSVEAAKKAFFEGDRDRAIEILKEIGWDKGKIGNILGKWKTEYEVTENAEKVYFEGDPKGAAQILKNELNWNNEKIRKAQLRWERQSTYGRMMTEQRGPETFKGKPVASYVPEEFAEKFNRSKLSRPAPKTSAIIADLEALWEETIETK